MCEVTPYMVNVATKGMVYHLFYDDIVTTIISTLNITSDV